MRPAPIKKLERFLNTDTLYLARGSFWMSLGSIVNMGVALLLSIAYARYIPKEVYGSYRYVFSVLGAAGIFALPGMAVIITQSVARGFSGTYRQANRIIFYGSIGISVISAGASIFFFRQDNLTLATAFLAGAIGIPFVEGLGNWRGYFDGVKAFKRKTILNIKIKIFYGISMLSAIFCIWFFYLPPMIATALLVSAYVIPLGIANIFAVRTTLQEVPPNAPIEPDSIRYGMHLSLGTVPTTIASYIDSIIVYHYLGPIALATYAFATAIPDQIKVIFINIASTTTPKLAQQAFTVEQKRELTKKLFRASIFTTLIILGYIIVAPLIYMIFFNRYLDAIPYSQVFVISLALFPFGIFGNAIRAEGNIKKNYILDSTVSGIQIVALLMLIPWYGLWGAIWGRVIGRFANNFFSYVLFRY